MARCPNCGAEAPAGSRYCPVCGSAQPRQPTPSEQPALPLSPFGPLPMATQAAGSGAGAVGRTEPVVGPPLTVAQVAIAVGAILLFLFFVILAGRGWFSRSAGSVQADGRVPVLGIKGELIRTGDTAWGVAFTDTMERLDSRTPQRGQFYTVGVIVANEGDASITLSTASLAMVDEESGERFTPTFTAWGTPQDFDEGRYQTRAPLLPEQALAGIIVFDTPERLGEPRLLVRDLTADSTTYTGAIDLTQEKEESPGHKLLDRNSIRVVYGARYDSTSRAYGSYSSVVSRNASHARQNVAGGGASKESRSPVRG